MAKYAVIYEGFRKNTAAPDSAKDLLISHIDFLKDMHSRGILFMCGPLKESNGMALLIFSAGSLEEAESYVSKDPFIIHKIYPNHRIYEWNEANDSNNWLIDR